MSRGNDEGVVQTVKDAADILEVVGEIVSLKKAGVNYKGLCPFHAEKTPSFTVNPARRSFHCFGCGEGGDALSFVMRYHNIGFWEAVKQLAGRYHIPLPEKELSGREREAASKRQALFAINQRAAQVYHELLFTPAGASARDYLEKRRIPLTVINDFQLGYAPESWDFLLKAMADVGEAELSEAGLLVQRESGKGWYDRFRQRVLFPIISHSGQYLGFGGRILGDGQPKYLNSPETLVFTKGKTLFGLFQNKAAIRKSHRALIVEGNFDLLSLVAAGVRDVVAPLGTALTTQHIHALKGYASEAVLLFDGDQAGIKAAMRAVPLFLSEKVAARVVILPDGHDPDTFVGEFGAEGLERRVEEAYSLPEFVVSHLVEKYGLGLEGKGKIVDELRPLIKAIADQDLQRSLFVAHFSQKLGLSSEQLLGALASPLTIIGPPEVKPPLASRLGKISLSKAEEQLVSFLIIYPEYSDQFIEAGLFDCLTQPEAVHIVNALQELHKNSPGSGAERLLDRLEGPARVFVSSQLISVPCLPDPNREAAEKIQWLRENHQKLLLRALTTRINEAHRQNDQELLLTLLLEQKKISTDG
jgi:DNA primase